MKPNTYTKLYAHCVFTPRGRESLLQDSFRIPVHKYIYGILSEKKCYPVAINGTKDHVHILFGFGPAICIADLMRDIKRSSALYINSKIRSYLKFGWQEGYGAFTVGYRELDKVYNYILNQEEHHKSKKFRDEYLEILNENGVEYKNEFVFKFYE